MCHMSGHINKNIRHKHAREKPRSHETQKQ